MLKAFKYRIYPTKVQAEKLEKHFGCARFVWNRYVEVFNSYDKESNSKPTYKSRKELKNEFPFLSEISSESINNKLSDFDMASKMFFLKKKGAPVYHKKGRKDSYWLSSQRYWFHSNNTKIHIEKIGKIKIVLDRLLPENCKFGNICISRNSANQYFVSITVESEIEHLSKTSKEVGIDIGLKEFAVLSDGIVVNNPKYLRKSQSKIVRISKHLSRKKKGSVRFKKNKLRLAKLHNDVANKRSYFLHNLSSFIVKNYDVICIEDLNVSGMVKNHKLAYSISDASWSEFRRQLEYKSNWYGKELLKVDRFFASSKTCSHCGNLKEDLILSDRTYNCSVCGLSIDRDLNASINIKNKALEKYSAIRTLSGEVTNCDEAFINDKLLTI